MNSRFQNNPSSTAGFTLLELMLSIGIMALISLSVYTLIERSFRIRDTILVDGDFYNGIRIAMEIAQRDVSTLYSPIIMLPPSQKKKAGPDAEREIQQMNPDLARSTQFWGGAVDTSGVRPSRFQGSENRISFISISNQRLYKDSKESIFQKVIYETRPGKTPEDGQTFVRVVDPNAFSDDDHRDSNTQQTYPLLKGIQKFRYRYYDRKKDRWLNAWDSDTEEFKNRYPSVVEIALEVKGEARSHFEGTYQFRPEIPYDGIPASF